MICTDVHRCAVCGHPIVCGPRGWDHPKGSKYRVRVGCDRPRHMILDCEGPDL